MGIPPGPAYIGRTLPSLIYPGLFTYGVLRWLRQQQGLVLPVWSQITIILLAKPFEYIVKTYYRRIKNVVEARKLGGQVVPHVEEPWPYFGGFSIVAQMVKNFKTGYIGDIIPGWAAKYGNTFELRLLNENQIWTVEPDHVKAILATQFENFEKGSLFINKMNSLLGTGVFNSDGDMWKFHRGITRPFFSRERISDFELFDKHCEQTLALAKARLAEGYAIDFQDLVARFTLDTSSTFLFGQNIDSLAAGIAYPANSGRQNPPSFTNHPSNIFVNAFFTGLDEVTLRSIMGQEWGLREFWADRVKPHREIVDQFLEPIMEKVLKERASGMTKADYTEKGEPETLLQHLVDQTQDTTVLKDELLNLMVAGRDTTACTLTFALYMLAEHPEITRRLREEVLEKVGEVRRPSYDDIRDMKYLRAFINEILRVYPAVPFDARYSNKGTLLTKKDGSTPLYIPANTTVVYSVWYMHRRKDLWGPTADEFDPDRFLDERLHKYLTPNPFIFTPFNAGPRICLGQQFAYQESSFFLIRLLQQFSTFSLALDAQPASTLPPSSWVEAGGIQGREKVMPAATLTTYVRGGLWIRMA